MLNDQQKALIKTLAPYALAAIASIWIWYLAIPALAMWWVIKKSHASRLKKIVACIGIVFVAVILIGLSQPDTPTEAPVIVITEPQSGYTTTQTSVVIKGTVTPTQSVITVGGIQVPATDGRFAYEARLPGEENRIAISAGYLGKETESLITVNRTMTPEEKAKRERQKAEAAARKTAGEEARRKAEEERLARENTVEYKVRAKVIEVLGEKTNTGKPTVIGVEKIPYTAQELMKYGYSKNDPIVSVIININSSENITSKLQRATMNKEAHTTFKDVFPLLPTIGDVIVWSHLPFQDRYGNLKDDAAVRYAMSRTLFDKVQWGSDGLSYNSLPNLLRSEGLRDERNEYLERLKF